MAIVSALRRLLIRLTRLSVVRPNVPDPVVKPNMYWPLFGRDRERQETTGFFQPPTLDTFVCEAFPHIITLRISLRRCKSTKAAVIWHGGNIPDRWDTELTRD